MFKLSKKIVTIKISEKVYSLLTRISFAKKRVPKGSWTDTHYHRFFSAYLIKNMEALKVDDMTIPMPKYGIVIVLPFINHTWINQTGNSEDCYVSDLSPGHKNHTIFK
jgi:hypothetical protein